MKTIMNDTRLRHGKGKDRKKFAINENIDYDEDDNFFGKVGGEYDFIMMVGNGKVYGFEGREIEFKPIMDDGDVIGFQWEPIKDNDVDFNWLPIDDEYDYDDDDEYWVPFEDMDIYDDEVEYDDDDWL